MKATICLLIKVNYDHLYEYRCKSSRVLLINVFFSSYNDEDRFTAYHSSARTCKFTVEQTKMKNQREDLIIVLRQRFTDIMTK